MSRIQPCHQTLLSDHPTFLVIGIPVVTIQQGFRLPMSLLSTFLKDKFSYKKPRRRPQQAKFKQDAQHQTKPKQVDKVIGDFLGEKTANTKLRSGRRMELRRGEHRHYRLMS
jgi:hypothetical protein